MMSNVAIAIEPPVKVVELSQNRKLGYVSATYASQSTCPATCPFRNAGCYAESGIMGIHTSKLNKSNIKDVDLIAQMEANGIDKLTGRFPLRLHVVGDTTTAHGAKVISDAAARHTAKKGQPVWTYTHEHGVPREAWGSVNVLRSCEKIEQVEQAFDDGYAAAMVVPEFDKETAYEIAPGIKGIPCPQQTGKAETCEACGLCMRSEKLRANRNVILFAAHGSRTKMVQNNIKAVQ